MRFELPLEPVQHEQLLDLPTSSKEALTLRLLGHVRLLAPLGFDRLNRVVDIVRVVALDEEFARPMRGTVVTGLLDAPASPELVGVVDAAGRLIPDSPFAGSATPELARDLYRWMVLARRLDQEAYNLQRQGELGLWLSCRGQEAAQIGSVSALRGSDHIFPGLPGARGRPVPRHLPWRTAGRVAWLHA